MTTDSPEINASVEDARDQLQDAVPKVAGVIDYYTGLIACFYTKQQGIIQVQWSILQSKRTFIDGALSC